MVGFNEQRIFLATSAFLRHVYFYRPLYRDKYIIEQLLKKMIYKYIGYRKFTLYKTIIFKEPLGLNKYDVIDNMRKIFPDMKVIFMIRHPVSVYNSMYLRRWGYSVRGRVLRDMPLEEGIKRWKSCAQICRAKETDKNLYACNFDSLVKNPEAESIKIKEFLKLKKLDVFKVKSTKELQLEEHVIKKILDETASEREIFGY